MLHYMKYKQRIQNKILMIILNGLLSETHLIELHPLGLKWVMSWKKKNK